MPNVLAVLLAAVQLALQLFSPQMMTQRLRSGEWLRFHVVAEDDSAEMQRVKLCVRDAVQRCFRENRENADASILRQAENLLPLLKEAAQSCALREGFTGMVDVALSPCTFGDRQLYGSTIPAGEYPALMIRLGNAQGKNWWGLLDPELSLWLACVPTDEVEDKPIIWDWSWKTFWAALFSRRLTTERA